MNRHVSVMDHPFVRSPHKTLIGLSIPVLLSLVAEPLTGLVDTAFVARLGSPALAALGVGAMVLSGMFWVFNFLGIGAQTQIAQAKGRQEPDRARQTGFLALALGVGLGFLVAAGCIPLTSAVSRAMGATGDVHELTCRYLSIRLTGAPAVLVSLAAFGILRGVMDMKTPLKIAVFVNVLNILLDGALIFGFGPMPPMGVGGAALASVISQWAGAVWAIRAVFKTLGKPDRLFLKDAKVFLAVGRDLFIRTGMIFLFLLLTTRAATRLGPEAGAAHQAVRQIWLFTALFLDAFAVSGQSLIGYFSGPGFIAQMRQTARVVCLWSLAAGFTLGLAMWAAESLVLVLLVPPEAAGVFSPAWTVAILTQPLNALAFATDGIHWGTGDYRYLRNAAFAASIGGIAALIAAPPSFMTLARIWMVVLGWLAVRAFFGMVRIWPGIGASPFRQ